jgi:hypothetical protein
VAWSVGLVSWSVDEKDVVQVRNTGHPVGEHVRRQVPGDANLHNIHLADWSQRQPPNHK